jgi:hypothetical protein
LRKISGFNAMTLAAMLALGGAPSSRNPKRPNRTLPQE